MKPSEETKANIRAAKLAHPWHPNDEQRAAAAAGRKGKPLTPEHRAKISAGCKAARIANGTAKQ